MVKESGETGFSLLKECLIGVHMRDRSLSGQTAVRGQTKRRRLVEEAQKEKEECQVRLHLRAPPPRQELTPYAGRFSRHEVWRGSKEVVGCGTGIGAA